MPLTPDLSEFKPKRSGCRIADVLKEITDPQQHVNLVAALENLAEVPHSSIEDWLAARDHPASRSVITKHRLGKCQCNAKA